MEPSLRAALPSDKAFLYALHCATMRDLIDRTWGWDEAWQLGDFEKRFEEHVVSLIERDARAVGCLWIEPRPDVVYISMILVVPELQGQGIGTAVMNQVLEQAAQRRSPVALSVLELNPRARLLYERLGFQVTATERPFIRMQHTPLGLERPATS